MSPVLFTHLLYTQAFIYSIKHQLADYESIPIAICMYILGVVLGIIVHSIRN